jgi:voltage-dependent potassium channel beta subunit
MEYRRLGNAGLRVSKVALGGWTTFGDSIADDALARQIITAAYDSGINFFDIADIYARGESERAMGKVLKDFARNTLVISSKVFRPMSDDINDRGLSRKHIMESIDKSLQRIGTDYLDIYYCHRFDPDTPLEETVRAMDDLIHQGKILYWGTSEWQAAEIAAAVGLARQYNLYPPQAEQPGYNLLRRTRVETQVLPVTEPNGIGLTVYSPLASGLLTGKYDKQIPQDSRMARSDGMRARFTEDQRERIVKLEPIANRVGLTRAQLALAWILHRPGISSVITGATKVEHVASNAKAAGISLDDETITEIEELFPL